jgi:predicted nucleic acid-binding Zn ribbon protein
MPTFESVCLTCGLEQEYFQTIANRDQVSDCIKCGGRCTRDIRTCAMTYPDLNDFHTENRGKGRFNHQLKQYVTSVDDAKAKAAKKGWGVLDEA